MRTWPEEPAAARPREPAVEVVLMDGPLRGRRFETNCGIIESVAEMDGRYQVVRYRVERAGGTGWLIRPAPPVLRWWRRLLARLPLARLL